MLPNSLTTFVIVAQHSFPNPTTDADRERIHEGLEDYHELGAILNDENKFVDAVLYSNSCAYQTAEAVVGEHPVRKVPFVQMKELYPSSEPIGKAFLARCQEEDTLGGIMNEVEPEILVVAHPDILRSIVANICAEYRCDDEEVHQWGVSLSHDLCQALIIQIGKDGQFSADRIWSGHKVL